MRSFVVTIGSGPFAPGSTLRERPMTRTAAVQRFVAATQALPLRRPRSSRATTTSTLPATEDLSFSAGELAAADLRAARGARRLSAGRAAVCLAARGGERAEGRVGPEGRPLGAHGDQARVVGRAPAAGRRRARSRTATRRTSATIPPPNTVASYGGRAARSPAASSCPSRAACHDAVDDGVGVVDDDRLDRRERRRQVLVGADVDGRAEDARVAVEVGGAGRRTGRRSPRRSWASRAAGAGPGRPGGPRAAGRRW